MDLCLVAPPIKDFYSTPHRTSGLGLRTVEHLARYRGHCCTYIDLSLIGKRTITLPNHLDYLREYIVPDEYGPTSFFTTYKRFGPSIPDCVAKIKEINPQLLLISCFAFCYADDTIELAEAVKKRLPALPILAGGGGCSVYPEYFLQSGTIDFLLYGEAEHSLLPFLDQFQREDPDFADVPNLYINDGNRWDFTGNGSTASCSLPFVWAKTRETNTDVDISTSLTRGCPKRCSFCSVHLIHGRTLTFVPTETIIDEITNLPKDKHIRLNFEDDNVLLDPEYLRSVMTSVRARFPDIEFKAENGIDFSCLSPELFECLVDAGFSQFNLTLGSTDKTVLHAARRCAEFEPLAEILLNAQKRSIRTITYCIAGMQNDSPSSALETILFLSRLPTLIGISLFYPVPGIVGFEQKQTFLSFPSSLTAGSSAYPWNGSLSTKQLVTLFRLTRTINFLKSPRLKARFPELADEIEKRRTLISLRKQGSGFVYEKISSIDKELVQTFFAGTSRHIDNAEPES